HKLGADEKAALTDMLDCMELVYLTPASYEIAIGLRQQRRLALGDALIAATCLEHSLGLETVNTDDFCWISELSAVNPLTPSLLE
ncbi:MAG: PIN domain-containing protein, partial [Rhodocyclaceae bacterium]|nr:PIN domain-containing protein [Rhodocyclaceae bacterium]